MMTDPCTCGIKPIGHAHIINAEKEEQILSWKGVPIIEDMGDSKVFFLNDANKKKL